MLQVTPIGYEAKTNFFYSKELLLPFKYTGITQTANSERSILEIQLQLANYQLNTMALSMHIW